MNASGRLYDRARGCLLAMAAGDALGMPAEFLSRPEVRKRFGVIRDYQRALPGHPCHHLQPGQYTDDTQMALALARSIVEAGRFDPDAAARHFLAWGTSADNNRGPGAACMAAVARLRDGASWRESGVHAAGCGPAMRAAPIGLINVYSPPERLVREAAESGLITHTDHRGVAGAVAVAAGVAVLARKGGEAIRAGDFLRAVAGLVEAVSAELSARLLAVESLLALPADEGLDRTGTGGFTLETVPAAFFCFLHYSAQSLEEAVILAANAGDDADSIAAITGALAGAYHGVAAVPARWLDSLENRSEIETLADRLADVALMYREPE